MSEVAKKFGPNGCQFMVDGQPCGETQTFEIVQQFKELYEGKLQEIEAELGGGDYLQAKVNLQQQWISDVTQQNVMLVRAVEELEHEATTRVAMLLERLQNSAQSGSDVMQKYKAFNFSINLDETLQKSVYLQSDVINLLEFIRRVRDDGKWNINGLQFYNIKGEDLFGEPIPSIEDEETQEPHKEQTAEELAKEQEKLKQLEHKLSTLPNPDEVQQKLQAKDDELARVKQTVEELTKKQEKFEELEDRLNTLPNPEEVQQMVEKLQAKEDELVRVRRSMMDMRNALTIEVADKHDIILNLRRDVQQLEEQCRQSNRQTQFKDDIIKELRKEIKQLRTQRTINADADNAELVGKSQAQNQTIQALQQALVDKESSQKEVNESASNTSWETTTTTKAVSTTPSTPTAISSTSAATPSTPATSVKPSKSAGFSETTSSKGLSGVDGLEPAGVSETTSSKGLSGVDELEPVESKMEASISEGIGASEIEQALRRGSAGQLQKLLLKLAEERDVERAKHKQEVANLKETIEEFERGLGDRQLEISGMQTQVDLYKNSINVLEAGQEKAKIEISQLRLTISNLQEALVVSKHQLDELQQKALSDIHKCVQYIRELKNILSVLENKYIIYYKQNENLNNLIENLRDSNLDLEVENFECIQDIAMMETRLLKYQSTFKNKEECICELENELIQRRVENTHLKQHLCSLTCELTAMQRVINEAKELHKSFIELQDAHECQIHHNDVIRQELIRQNKINEIDGIRLAELQDMVVEKSEEADNYEQQLFCCQKKLDVASQHNDELKTEVTDLLEHIKNYQENCILNEERTDYCQQEIENCKDNLTELKDKLLLMSDLLHKKIEDYNQLETNYCVQGNTLACLEKQIAGSQIHHDEDSHNLTGIIKELTEKMTEAENNNQTLHEDYKRAQAQVVELTRREAMLEQECTRCKQEYKQKLDATQNEMICINECLNKLNMAKSSQSLQKKVVEDELENLKNDFLKVNAEYKDLKTENSKLKNQLCNIQRCMASCKDQCKSTSDQYNKCVEEMKNQQCEKRCLEVENKQYKKELQMIQRAHEELNQSYDELFKSVITLETELADCKNDRDKICVESRNVINNVQAWLQDQAYIKKQLTQKLKDNSVVIYKLKQKIATLRAWKNKCKMQEDALYQRKDTCPRLCHLKDATSGEDYYYEQGEEEYGEDDNAPCYCLQRVETVMQQVQKSNKFWASQMEGDTDYMVTKDQ